MSRLVIVTATTNPTRALDCLRSWGDAPIIAVANHCDPCSMDSWQGPAPITWLTSDDYLGTVPAFRRGVDFALEHTDADVIAALHDDVEILEGGWDDRVLRHFDRQPACGLAGFGGAIGLGSDDLYQTPYNPMQLARQGFRSNMRDAEKHGVRSLWSEQVACLDGFALIGRRAFWAGKTRSGEQQESPWALFGRIGVLHHAYDSAMGALAARYKWETWYLPIRCHHFGGRTAVGDAGYQAWAAQQIAGGDQGFWITAHRAIYDEFRAELPLRL